MTTVQRPYEHQAGVVTLDARRGGTGRRWRRRLLAVTIVVVVVGLLGFVVYATPLIAVRQVTVAGNAAVTTQQILDAARIETGTPLVRLDLGAAQDRVAAVPQIAHATVTRSLGGAVRITVAERTPVFALQVGPTSYQLVDKEAKIYLAVEHVPAGLLPVTMPSPTTRLLTDAGTVVTALPAPLTARVATVEVTSPDRIVLHLTSGATVMWGSADQSALKAQVLTALLSVPATSYDVSAPSHPATK